MRDLKNIAGIGKNQLSKFNEENKFNVEDLTKEDIKNLNEEAQLTIKYTKDKYTRKEIETFMNKFSSSIKGKYEVCGSYRRKLPESKDIDLLVIGTVEVKEGFKIRSGELREKYILPLPKSKIYIPVDIFYTSEECWPFSLLHFTGSKNFNIQMRAAAIKKGLKLNEYGLFKGGKELTGFKTEEDIMKKILGKVYKPEERNK